VVEVVIDRCCVVEDCSCGDSDVVDFVCVVVLAVVAVVGFDVDSVDSATRVDAGRVGDVCSDVVEETVDCFRVVAVAVVVIGVDVCVGPVFSRDVVWDCVGDIPVVELCVDVAGLVEVERVAEVVGLVDVVEVEGLVEVV